MTHTSARRPRRSRVAPSRIALGAAVAGCTGLALLVPTSAGAGEARPGLTHNVAIVKFRFVPHSLGIDIGDTVRWVNTDADEHNVRYVRGPQRFGMAPLETLVRGEKYRHTFSRRGSYQYECTIHGERGEVRVGPKETTAVPNGRSFGPVEENRPRRIPPVAPPLKKPDLLR